LRIGLVKPAQLEEREHIPSMLYRILKSEKIAFKAAKSFGHLGRLDRGGLGL
jgi:hypothetical protein